MTAASCGDVDEGLRERQACTVLSRYAVVFAAVGLTPDEKGRERRLAVPRGQCMKCTEREREACCRHAAITHLTAERAQHPTLKVAQSFDQTVGHAVWLVVKVASSFEGRLATVIP